MRHLAAAVLALSALSDPALSQSGSSYPYRTIRLILPFPPGSSADVVSRVLVQKLGDRIGQQVIIENRPGASGSIGADLIAKAAPDGYTMGMVTGSTHAVAPALGAKLPYDTVKDFKPITMIGSAPYVLVLYPGVPAKNIMELVALAKTKPGQLNYGSAGLASLAHLASAQFASQMDIELTHVPYKSTAQSSIDIMTGRLDMQFATIAPTLANIKAGQLRALATTGSRRPSALPDVPTMAEAGVAGYDVALWLAYAMPAATPDAIATRLNREFTAILNDPDTQEQLRQRGFEPEPGPPETVTARIVAETNMWRALAAKTGIAAQ